MSEPTELPGFEWMPGMYVNHIGQPMRVLSVERDEWLGTPFSILLTHCKFVNGGFCTIIVKNETFLDLKDPATGGCLHQLLGFATEMIQNEGETLAEACVRTALSLGRWPANDNKE